MAKALRTTAEQRVVSSISLRNLERRYAELQGENALLQSNVQQLLDQLDALEAEQETRQVARDEVAWEVRAQAALHARDVAAQRDAEGRAQLRGYKKGLAAGRQEERARQFREAARLVPGWLIRLLRLFGHNLNLLGPAWLSECHNPEAMQAAVRARISSYRRTA